MLGLCKVTSFDRYLCWLEHFGKDTYRAALQRKVADDIVQRISASLRRGGYKPQDLFSKLDADGSGQLSRQELLSIVLRLEPGLSPAEQEAIFQRFDADGSGSVSWAEFWETIQGGGAAQPLAQTLPARVGVAGALPLRPLDPGSGLAATAPAQQPVAVQAGGFDQTIHPQDPGAAVELQRQRAMAEEILARIAANIVRAGRRPQEFLRDARGTLARGEVEQTLFRFEPNLSAYEREAIISRLGADGHLAAQRVRRYGNVNAAEFCRILGGDLAQIGKSLVQPAEVPVGMAPQELLKQVATETEFCKEVESIGKSRASHIYELDEPLIRAKGANMICPRDGRLGAAFVDTIRGKESRLHRSMLDFVGRANHMLSYTWQYTVSCISSSLEAWCLQHAKQSQRTYVWTCFMGINQHRVQAGKTLPQSSAVASAALDARHVIALMEPWRAPKYCRRAWCVFELHTALQAGQLDIVMPPGEAQGFAQAVYDGDGLQDLSQRAQAAVNVDKENIFRMVEQSCGFSQLNSSVVLELQRWFAGVAFDHVKTQMVEEISAKVADLFRSLGQLDKADSLLESAFEMIKSLQEEQTPLHASLLGAMGHERGDLDGALALLQEGYRILQLTTVNSEEGALLLTRLGHVKFQQKDLEAADGHFREALEAHNACRSLCGFDGAQLLQSLGHVQRERKDLTGALSSYQQAQEILCGCELLQSPAGAALVASMGHLQREQGNLEGRQMPTKKNTLVLEAVGCLQTANGATLLVNIGHVQRSMGDPDAALATYKEARGLFKVSGSWDTPAGMNTAYNNFVAYGDWDSAEFACFAGLPCISPFVPLHSLERRLALLFLLRTHLVEIDAWRRWLQPDGFGLDAQPSVSLFFHLADGLEAAGPEAIAALQALPRARVIPTVATGWCELMAAEVALFQAALQHEPSAEMLVLLPHDVGSLLQACSMDKSSSSTFRGDASSSALRGGVAAVLVQTACVPTFMWMHTVTNYQYRYGGTAIDVVRALYAEGGPRRFYRGIVPALLQSAILRFGGLAVNEGLLAATARSSMDGPCASHGLSSTMAAATSSLATSVLRVVLMPLDAWQTAKQVNGEHGFKRVLKEARSRPSATIGFAANVAGDASSNFLRVLKTLQQTAGREMTYMSAAKELLRQDGVRGLFGRGLPTKVILVLERKALLDGNAGVSRICPAGVRDVEVPHDCAHGIEPHWARSLMLKHHQWIALSRNHAAHLVHPQALAAANGIFESEYLGEPLCSDEVLPLLTLALKEQVVQDKAPAEQVLAQGPMECKVVHSWDELLHILSAGSHERCENLQVAARGDMPIRMSLSLSSAFAMNQSLLELTLTVDARAALGLQGLGQNTTLRHLSLHVLHWGACGELGRAVAAVLKQNSSLQSLCLKADATNLSDKTGVVLAQALTQNSSLSRFLVASVNSLPLAPAGHSFILVSFDELEGSRCARGMSFSTQETSVGDETGTALAEALQQNCNLQSFHFSANGTEVSDDSGIALASILSVNSALQKFSFKACKTEISDSTGTAIASSLCSNSSLRSFSFLANSCNISDETCQAMADSIGNTCLTSVEFVALHVFVSEKTITCLQNALHRNRGLQSVRFETSQDGACVTVREGKAMQDQVRCEHKQNGSAYPTYPCFQVPLFAQSFGKDFLETSLSHSSDWGSAIVIESEHGEDMVLRSGKLSCADSLSETDVGDAEAVTTASTDAHEAPIWESFGV
eukprot:s755_g22.t2